MDLLKRKEFAPLGSKFFPFTEDHFQKEFEMQETNRKSQYCLPCRKKVTEKNVPSVCGLRNWFDKVNLPLRNTDIFKMTIKAGCEASESYLVITIR